MNWKPIYGGLLCFAVGGVTGALLTSNPEKPSGELAARPVAGKRVWKRSATEIAGPAPIHPSTGENPNPEALADEALIEVPASLLETLSRAKAARRIDQPILDDRDPAEAALGLTPTEKIRIQHEWEKASEDLRQLETRALNSTDLEDGSVQLKLPDLSKERRQVAGSFMTSLNNTLGDDRGAAFSAIKQVNGLFAANSGERTINVKVESVGEGRWGYRMTLEDASGKRVWVGDRIPRELRHLADAAKILPTIADAVQSMAEE